MLLIGIDVDDGCTGSELVDYLTRVENCARPAAMALGTSLPHQAVQNTDGDDGVGG
jgi:hypothetical protein